MIATIPIVVLVMIRPLMITRLFSTFPIQIVIAAAPLTSKPMFSHQKTIPGEELNTSSGSTVKITFASIDQ